MEKMTYISALTIAIESANLTPEVTEKLTALKERLARKTTAERKPTKTQVANAGLEAILYSSMEPNRAYTVTELIKEIPELAEMSNQKVSALVRGLKNAQKVVREEVKGRSYFTKVEA